MSTRLQVVVDDQELAKLRRSPSGTVRPCPSGSARFCERLGGVSPVATWQLSARFPTADIEVMLGEIERGYLSGAE